MATKPTMARAMSPNEQGDEIKVHPALGPGLLESAYHGCLAYELRKAGLKLRRKC